MKNYKAIFFDWDGTAVLDRNSPSDDVISKMIPLLKAGKKLIIISGTVYENIASGKLHSKIPIECLNNLYLGLGRGAYNYGFDNLGNLIELGGIKLSTKQRLLVDKTAFDVHSNLFSHYGIQTDIIFSRPNYCKVDLMVNSSRQNHLFLQDNEIEKVKSLLIEFGYMNGLKGILKLAKDIGVKNKINVFPTTDAKYLEIGTTTKSDNVNFFMDNVICALGINQNECCFWGDEFRFLDDGVLGSDALMITNKTRQSNFFDVSDTKGHLPEEVVQLGGSTTTFINFLSELASSINSL